MVLPASSSGSAFPTLTLSTAWWPLKCTVSAEAGARPLFKARILGSVAKSEKKTWEISGLFHWSNQTRLYSNWNKWKNKVSFLCTFKAGCLKDHSIHTGSHRCAKVKVPVVEPPLTSAFPSAGRVSTWSCWGPLVMTLAWQWSSMLSITVSRASSDRRWVV